MAEYYCDFRTARSLDDLKIMLDRFFNWFFMNLDSMNVTSITTDITTVQSEDGTTVIQGPVLVMKDAAGVIRAKLGYDATLGTFVFQLFNAAGVNNIDLDGSGNGVITGGTIRTAASGERVELSGNSMKIYNAGNKLNGIGTGSGVGATYGDAAWFDEGVEVLRFFNNLVGGGYTIRPMNGAALYLGYPGFNTYINGAIRFFDSGVPATKTSVSDPSSVVTTETAGDSYTSNEQTMLDNLRTDVENLRSKLKSLCDALQSYGLI